MMASGRRTSTASLAKAAAKEAHIQAVCEAKGISDDELAHPPGRGWSPVRRMVPMGSSVEV